MDDFKQLVSLFLLLSVLELHPHQDVQYIEFCMHVLKSKEFDYITFVLFTRCCNRKEITLGQFMSFLA